MQPVLGRSFPSTAARRWLHCGLPSRAMQQTSGLQLPEAQAKSLERLAAARGVAVTTLVQEAVDFWLQHQGSVDEEWQRRFDELMARRREVAERLRVTDEGVERDVVGATDEARGGPAASRP